MCITSGNLLVPFWIRFGIQTSITQIVELLCVLCADCKVWDLREVGVTLRRG